MITGVGGLAVKRLGFVLPKEVAPIAWATLIGGIVILLVEWGLRGRSVQADVTWRIAVAVGLAQLLAAVFPGTSRAAATIMIAMLLGLARPIATEFSFLVGVPTLLAAGGLETVQALRHPAAGPPNKWGMLALGTVVVGGDRVRGGALAAALGADPQLRALRLVPHRPRAADARPLRLIGVRSYVPTFLTLRAKLRASRKCRNVKT